LRVLKKLFRKRVLLALAAVLAAGAFCQANYQVPVLMYHRVDHAPPGVPEGLCVSPETFEKQMEFLKIHGYRVIRLEELVRATKEGRRLPFKSVVLTFDDGTMDNIENAFPTLKKMDFPATIFMIAQNVGKGGWLSTEDLRLMDASGITIGSHTVTHAFLPSLTEEEARGEIVESKRVLETLLEHPVTLFSYPAGGFTELSKVMVENAGYEGAVTTNHGRRKGDPYALHRIKVKESKGSLFNFWAKTTGLYHIGKKRIKTS